LIIEVHFLSINQEIELRNQQSFTYRGSRSMLDNTRIKK